MTKLPARKNLIRTALAILLENALILSAINEGDEGREVTRFINRELSEAGYRIKNICCLPLLKKWPAPEKHRSAKRVYLKEATRRSMKDWLIGSISVY